MTKYLVHWTKQLRIGLNNNNFQMLYPNGIKNGNIRDKKIPHMEDSSNKLVSKLGPGKR